MAEKLSCRATGWLFCALLFAVHPPLGAQPKALASLQPERIETGDTATLLVFVSGLGAAPGDVDFASWAGVLPGNNIIGRTDWRRSGTQWTRRFTLIAFDSATLNLPALRVRVAGGKFLETNALQLSVFPTRGGREISDMAKIREIRREPASWLDYWPWAAGVTAVMGLLFWWLRKNRRRVLVPPPVAMPVTPAQPVISPGELALQKLSQLQQKQLWKSGAAKEHYAELSLILREYLESKHGISALESTTSEIQKMLAATNFPADRRSTLQELLEKADLVKYAQSQPAEAVHLAVLEKARALVSAAVPAPSPPRASHNAPPKSGKYEPL